MNTPTTPLPHDTPTTDIPDFPKLKIPPKELVELYGIHQAPNGDWYWEEASGEYLPLLSDILSNPDFITCRRICTCVSAAWTQQAKRLFPRATAQINTANNQAAAWHNAAQW